MIRRTSVQAGQQVDFVLDSQSPVSVVGDFNDWDPARGAMAPDDAGLRTWSIVLQPGRYTFRYLRDGEFFDDPHADEFEPNGHGQHHGVLVVSTDASTSAREPTPPTPRASVAPKPTSGARKRSPATKAAKTSPAATGASTSRRARGSAAEKTAETTDHAARAEHRLDILSEIEAGRSVQVHGTPEYLDLLRRSLLDARCSMYLSEVEGERVLVVDPSPGESGTEVVDIRDAPST